MRDPVARYLEFSRSQAGIVVLLFLSAGSLALPALAQSPGAFTATGRLITPRSLHTSTLLNDGKVLIAGGDSAYYFSRTEASAEIYDPATGTFAPAGSLTTARSGHTATLLPNGKVLITGGGPTLIGTGPFSLSSAELYDPSTGKFTSTGNMTVERSQHNATLLKNGKVLITGGYRLVGYPAGLSFPASAEVYDPATGTFAPASGMSGSFCDTATLLADGRVLVTKRDPDQDRVSHAEIYDPSTGAFVPTGDMVTGHSNPTATLLANGKVLIAGGDIGDLDGSSVSAELYDPVSGTFAATGNLTTGRAKHAAVLLPDGTVLLAGGHGYIPVSNDGYDNLASAEIYSPSTGVFTAVGSMITGRDTFNATLLNNGKVLITGGNEYYLPWAAGARDFRYPEVPVAELYTPQLIAPPPSGTTTATQTPGTFTAAGFMTTPRAGHSATLLMDGRVLIVGGDQTGTAELYDPAAGTFTPTGNGTTGHGGAAALLPDGRVLIAAASKYELYDPYTGGFTPGGSVIAGQGGPTAISLSNGKVLFTGGDNGYTDPCTTAIPADPALYDPSTGLFSLAGPYDTTGFPTDSCSGGTSGLAYTAAALLDDGTVLITSEPAAEVYDPVANTFHVTGGMVAIDEGGFLGRPTQIDGRTATLMTNGKVLAAGGDPAYVDTSDFPLSRAEVYDPSTGTFASTGSMRTARESHSATLLPDGTVLITGGRLDNWYDAAPLAELYDPRTDVFVTAAAMNGGRSSHQATLLNDGRVLITGGLFTGPYSVYEGRIHSSAEIYNPAILTPAPALLSLSGDGQGQGAIQHAGTTRIASASDPAVAGEYLSIYLTGLANGSAIPPKVSIGGHFAGISFFGTVPGYTGLNVINVLMPGGVAAGGAVSVRLMYIGQTSNEVTIGVR